MEKNNEYMSFHDCLEELEEPSVQPSMLERSVIITELRKMIAEKSANKNDPVKFYTAINTPLDYYHGVDAYFRQGDKIVTVDVSLRDKQLHNADVLLPLDFDDDGKILIKQYELEKVAEEIARRLNMQF